MGQFSSVFRIVDVLALVFLVVASCRTPRPRGPRNTEFSRNRHQGFIVTHGLIIPSSRVLVAISVSFAAKLTEFSHDCGLVGSCLNFFDDSVKALCWLISFILLLRSHVSMEVPNRILTWQKWVELNERFRVICPLLCSSNNQNCIWGIGSDSGLKLEHTFIMFISVDEHSELIIGNVRLVVQLVKHIWVICKSRGYTVPEADAANLVVTLWHD